MKKILSMLLAGAMLAGTMPMALAADPANLKELMATVDGLSIPLTSKINVDADIEVKENGDSDDSYKEKIAIKQKLASDLPSFDYKATLYMDAVKKAFDDYIRQAEGLIERNGGANKEDLKDELENIPVTGEFTVTIKNPNEMIIPDAIKVNDQSLNGFNDETAKCFTEKSRKYEDNTMTIVIEVAEDMTKAKLAENLGADLTLSCDGVAVNGFGTYELIGTIEGYTKIGDNPATTDEDESIAVIEYKAVQKAGKNADTDADIDAIVDASKKEDTTTSRPGTSTGGSSVSSFTVTTEVDGASVDKKTSTSAITYNPYDLDAPEKDKNLFAGWYNKSTDEYISGAAEYTKTTTITAKWIPTGDVNVDFVINGAAADVNTKKDNSVNVSEEDITVDENGTVINLANIDIVVPAGMKFEGWFTDAECTVPAEDSITAAEDVTIYGKTSKLDGSDILDTAHHYAYIIGYPDGYVRPEQNISREEVATIFFRLLTEEARTELLKKTNDFADVEDTRWSNNAISTMEGYGLITGYADGTFRPSADITRAEFVTMAARFYEIENGASTFADVQGHWAEKYISSATSKGWITGYEDGTFRPDQYITRAEAMTIINNVLGRQVDGEGLHEDAVQWTDNVEGAWYYYEVLEATNSHNCEDRAEGVITEKWTECVENYDWSILEK